MKIRKLHTWDVTYETALEIQDKLRRKTDFNCPFSSLKEIKIISGCDVAYSKDGRTIAASMVTVSLPENKIIEKVSVKRNDIPVFNYIPGLFAFREGPPLVEALRKSKSLPDVIIFDGHGIAHPARMGIAVHIGILTDKPTIGCAGNILYGEFTEPPPSIKGAYNYLRSENGEILGIVLRTKPFVKPLFVSPGNKMNVEIAGDLILAACSSYRVPDVLRYAHQEAQRKLA